jgi:predicted S18 family serine protease
MENQEQQQPQSDGVIIKDLSEMKFSKKNFEELKRLYVEKQQEVNMIYGVYEQNTSLIEALNDLKKSLSREEKKTEYYREFVSVLCAKIKALKLNVKFYKKRIKLNRKSID